MPLWHEEVWLQTQLTELKKLQNQCIWIINKELTSSNITGQYEKLNILNIEQLIKLHLCKLGHMISHSQLPSPIHKVFNERGGQKMH